MQLYTLNSAAERLAVTRKTLYALHSKGQLEFVKIGAATRIAKDELERFVKANSDGTRRTSVDLVETQEQQEHTAQGELCQTGQR